MNHIADYIFNFINSAEIIAVRLFVKIFVAALIMLFLMYINFFYRMLKWVKTFNFHKEKYKKILYFCFGLMIYLISPLFLRQIFKSSGQKMPVLFYYLMYLPSIYFIVMVLGYNFFFIFYSGIKYFYKSLIFLIEKIPKTTAFANKLKFSQSRRDFFKKLTPAVPGVLFGYTLFGNLRYTYAREISRHVIKTNNISREFDGFTFVHLTDVHAGIHMKRKALDELVENINSIDKHIIFLTGDYVDFNHSYTKEFVQAFNKLKHPEHGVFACMGNHEIYNGYETMAKTLTNCGFHVLRNSHKLIKKSGKNLVICGVEDLSTGKCNVADALSGTPHGYKILLCHQPNLFNEFSKKYDFDLMLSGHTHGGQINIIDIKGLRIAPSYLITDYLKGFYKENGKLLYVNRGYGVTGLPIRINADPEIAVMKFKKV